MAARYFVGGGTGNWNSTTNWSATDGGASGASFPLSSDDVYLTSSSGVNTLTINVASQCLTLTCTGFTGTLTGSSTLGVFGNVTLGAGMTVTYTGILSVIAVAATLTSNGKVWTGGLTLNRISSIYTLSDDWTIELNFFVSLNSTGINGSNLYLKKDFTQSGGCYGSTIIHMIGTGLLRLNYYVGNNLVINTAGTITIQELFLLTGAYTNGITYITGTTISTSTLAIPAGTRTFDTKGDTSPLATTTSSTGINWHSITFTGGINTLTSPLTCINTFSFGAAIINTSNIYLNGNLTATSIGGAGNSTMIIQGTGTWSGNFAILNNLTINTAGTLTISGSVAKNTNTLLYVTALNVITTGSTLAVVSTTTLNTNGIIWNNITFSNPTITLTSNLNINGTLLINNATVTINGFIIYTRNLTMTSGSAGTTDIVLNSTGIWSGTGQVGNNLTINTAGIITLGTSTNFGGAGKTLTYTSGTVITTGNTLTTSTTCIYNTAGIIWNNVSIFVQGTLTNNSLLTINGTLNYGTAAVGLTLAGTAGWTCGTFTIATAGLQHTFTTGNTYTINTAFNITNATNASRITLKSGTPGTKVVFILNPGASQNVGYVNATDLDSSLGQTIFSFNGVITTTLNWNLLTYPRPHKYIY